MKFLIDAQLPPALVRLFEGAGCEAEHVIDVGMASCDEFRNLPAISKVSIAPLIMIRSEFSRPPAFSVNTSARRSWHRVHRPNKRKFALSPAEGSASQVRMLIYLMENGW